MYSYKCLIIVVVISLFLDRLFTFTKIQGAAAVLEEASTKTANLLTWWNLPIVLAPRKRMIL